MHFNLNNQPIVPLPFGGLLPSIDNYIRNQALLNIRVITTQQEFESTKIKFEEAIRTAENPEQKKRLEQHFNTITSEWEENATQRNSKIDEVRNELQEVREDLEGRIKALQEVVKDYKQKSTEDKQKIEELQKQNAEVQVQARKMLANAKKRPLEEESGESARKSQKISHTQTFLPAATTTTTTSTSHLISSTSINQFGPPLPIQAQLQRLLQQQAQLQRQLQQQAQLQRQLQQQAQLQRHLQQQAQLQGLLQQQLISQQQQPAVQQQLQPQLQQQIDETELRLHQAASLLQQFADRQVPEDLNNKK